MNIQEYLLETFPHDPRYFVEAGAHDGVGDSQTLKLEQAGWQGLCIEPSNAFDGLTTSRRCNVSNYVLGTRDGEEVIFREMTGNAVELSGVVKHFGDHWDRESRGHADRLVKTTSLTTALKNHDAPTVIQFLALDTEGSELAILSAHDFVKFAFLVMEVEYNGVEQRKIDLIKLLAQLRVGNQPKGYKILNDDGINLFFIHESVKP